MRFFNREEEIEQIYDDAFYAEQSPFSINSAKKIVPYLSTILPQINSVIDVGCGIGAWLNEWKLLGKEVFGIDGNEIPDNARKISYNEYLRCDLEQPFPKLQKKFDLCSSLEVAEHLTPERAETFVKDLCSFSDIVLFSAAIPGQTGVNHINEQWQHYWADIFLSFGYKPVDVLRDCFWDDSDVGWWYAQNMILYVKSTYLLPKELVYPNRILDRVHPKCFEMYYKKEIAKKHEENSVSNSPKHRIKNKLKKLLK